MPRGNSDYWTPKLRRNVERDRWQTTELSKDGWTVLRFWEHEDPDSVATAIELEVRHSGLHQ